MWSLLPDVSARQPIPIVSTPVCCLVCLRSVKERERNVLFNNTLNTFYLRLYGVRHMVKDHSDSEKGNPLPPHRLLFPINSKFYFICTIPQPLLHQLAGTRNSSMGSVKEGRKEGNILFMVTWKEGRKYFI